MSRMKSINLPETASCVSLPIATRLLHRRQELEDELAKIKKLEDLFSRNPEITEIVELLGHIKINY